MKRNWIGFLVCVSILLNGCGPAPRTAEVLDPDRGNTPGATLAPTGTPRPTLAPPSATPEPTVERDVVTVEPTQPTRSPVTQEVIAVTPLPTAVPPTDAGSNALIEKAKADLAQRLNLDSSDIVLIEFRSVIWSDSSLGCPAPDMAYMQVLVEGYLIKLGVDQRVFEYHGGQGRDPFLCANPA